MKKLAFILFISLLAVTACKKDDEPFRVPDLKFSNGVFIINEGGFLDGTGSISFYSKSSNTVEHDLFQKVNGVPLGNVAQSLTHYNGRIYIVVNN